MVIEKTRYFIFISYKGTSYHGWQLQPNSVTVQKILDNALSLILGEEISTTGAGRTDTGVHAAYFCAHFDSISPLLSSDEGIIFKLNRFLPPDISIISINKVHPDANARFSAISRTYKYYISQKKDPFTGGSSWYLYGDIDTAKMNEACNILEKHNDFECFSKLHSNNKTNICRIYKAVWTTAENRIVFTIKADRFLRNMVRSIVGTMIEVGYGKMSLKEFDEIIISGDRTRVGQSAPAKGLFLSDIEYPREIFIPEDVDIK
jgi:tRNA pseudouridine38-40 synthase